MADIKRMTKAQLLDEIEQLRVRIAELEEEHSRELDARKSLELQALILDQISDLVTVTDLEGRITYVNEAEVQAMGRPRSALIGQSVEIYGEDATRGATQQQILSETLKKGQWRGEVVNYQPDGTERILDCRTQMLRNRAGKAIGLCGISTDITERKRSEEALRESEEKFRNMFENCGAIMYLLDPESLQIIDANAAAVRFYGYSRETLLSMRVTDLHTLSEAEIRAEIVAAGAKDRDHYSFKHRLVDGSVRDVEIRSTLLTIWGGKPAFFSIVTDVTERRRAQEALRESEERLRTLFEEMLTGFILLEAICDPPGNVTDLRILQVNPAFEEKTGLRAEKILNKTLLEVLPQIDPYWIRLFGETALTGKTNTFERYAPALNGYYEGTVYGPVPGRCAVFLLDITERWQAETQLREREATLRTVLAAAPIGIGRVTNRIINWVNQQIEIMTGYSSDELLGRNARMLYESDSEYERVGLLKYAKIQERGIGTLETRWKRRDGTMIDILLSSSPIDPGDLGAGVVFTAMDISERKRAESERRQLEAQVQHAQKLESLGILAGGIAHDFNNLLMGVLGNAELALDALPTSSPAHRSIKDIQAAGKRAAELCRQMLAYSGKGRFVVEVIDFNQLVDELGHLLKVSVSKKAALKFEFASDLPAIEADPAQIGQVLMNLITNASEAIGEESGIISVRTGVVYCDHEYLSEAYAENDLPEGRYVFVEVSDTGCGMTPEVLSKIFDPFFTTKFTGRGLGLSAVLGIVRGHKGALKVYSEPGRGTTFKVLFPAVDRPAEAFRRREAAGDDWRGAGTMLLADDEDTVRVVAQRMLERMGFRVISARDGQEAIRIFKENLEDIRCVLLDLTMPNLDGEQVFVELRRLRSDIPVVVASGYNEQEIASRFAGKGLSGVVQKPYQYATLRTAIRQALSV